MVAAVSVFACAACANVWGFHDLSTGDASVDGGTVAVCCTADASTSCKTGTCVDYGPLCACQAPDAACSVDIEAGGCSIECSYGPPDPVDVSAIGTPVTSCPNGGQQ